MLYDATRAEVLLHSGWSERCNTGEDLDRRSACEEASSSGSGSRPGAAAPGAAGDRGHHGQRMRGADRRHAERPADLTGDLTVLDWAGYDAEDFWIDFKNTYPNVDVTFEFGASDADIYGKMKAGSQADVFHPYTGWLQFYVDEGLVEEIDTSRLTNWDKVPDPFKALGQFDGKQYFVPCDWGFSSVLYRTDQIASRSTAGTRSSIPQYAGHISMWDDGPGAVTVSSYVHGWDETHHRRAARRDQAEWTARRQHNLFYWVGEPELVPMVQNGDVWVGLRLAGRLRDPARRRRAGRVRQPEGRPQLVGRGLRHPRGHARTSTWPCAFLDDKLGDATGENLVDLSTTARQPGRHGRDHRRDAQGGFSIDDPTILDRPTSRRTSPPSSATPGRRCGPRSRPRMTPASALGRRGLRGRVGRRDPRSEPGAGAADARSAAGPRRGRSGGCSLPPSASWLALPRRAARADGRAQPPPGPDAAALLAPFAPTLDALRAARRDAELPGACSGLSAAHGPRRRARRDGPRLPARLLPGLPRRPPRAACT